MSEQKVGLAVVRYTDSGCDYERVQAYIETELRDCIRKAQGRTVGDETA